MVFALRRPSERDIAAFVEASRELPLSYSPVGLARTGGDGFDADTDVVQIGQGEAVFARAREALSRWRHFELGWVELFPRGASITPGTVVAILTRHLGFWSLSACRVVYLIEEPGTFGFAYGTLPNHAESGEEIFSVTLNPASGAVVYEIRAVSRPQSLLTRLGYPVARRLQARFRRDSARALARASHGP